MKHLFYVTIFALFLVGYTGCGVAEEAAIMITEPDLISIEQESSKAARHSVEPKLVSAESEQHSAQPELVSAESEQHSAQPESASTENVQLSTVNAQPEVQKASKTECVIKVFEPTVPGIWIANCIQYINLRKTADKTDAILQIPAGDSVEFLEWSGKYAKVSYKGITGYVMNSYIMPKVDNYFGQYLKIVKPTADYAYEQMIEDISIMEKVYPEIVSTEILGNSELDREIPVFRIGNEDAEYHVFLQGAIHGREHMTAWLLMAMCDYWLQHDITSYGDICYHVIPMCNPDGVVISQSETLTATQKAVYQRDVKKGYTTDRETRYAALWKANGLGVDINRNFPTGWVKTDVKSAPSSQGYQGEEPFSTVEAKILRDYTLRYDFDATISYHATGSLIYYEYGKKKDINSESKSLAKAIQEVTGYTLMNGYGVVSGGYKDWAMDEQGIPSITIEVGCEGAPLAQREIYGVFARNYGVLPIIASWFQQ